MKDDASEPHARSARTAAIALAVTLAIQVFTSLAATAPAVLAPAIARDFAVAPKLVGVFVGLIYVGSMFASLVSGWFIERNGPIRVSQVCVLLCAGGLAMTAMVPPVHALLLGLAPLIIGLGYGPITPASSQVLARTAPPSRMAVTFSIKQTGVPGGAALGGAMLPGLALTVGWRTAFIAVAFLGLFIAAVAHPARKALDGYRQDARPVSLAAVLAPLRLVSRHPALVELSLIGLIYAATQACLMSFLVVYLTETLGFSLVAAGLALTVANLGGIVGRIGWGGVADCYVRPRTLLGLLGLSAGTCAYLTAGFGPAWPALAVLAVCAAFGSTAIGWNGVQLAELARHAPKDQAGAVTGASGFVTFSGVVLGPPAFALLSMLTGSYRAGFGVFGSLSLGCGLWLLSKSRQ